MEYCEEIGKELNLFSFVRPFQLRIFFIPFDKKPEPNCGDNEYGDKKKREHLLVALFSYQLTFCDRDFPDFGVQIP